MVPKTFKELVDILEEDDVLLKPNSDAFNDKDGKFTQEFIINC